MGPIRRTINLAAAGACLALALPIAAHARAGDVDPTFGLDGMASHPASSVGNGGIALTQDDRVVVPAACDDDAGYVARLERDGRIDRGFGDNGHARLGMCGLGTFIQRNGKVVVVGGVLLPRAWDIPQAAVARLEPDGTPDRSFGTMGGLRLPLDGAVSGAYGAAEDRQGRLIIMATGRYGTNEPDKMFIVRLLPDGSPDPTFGNDGVRVLAPESWGSAAPTAVAVDKDGRIVVAGYFREPVENWRDDWVLARLKPGGALDSSFGDGGFTVSRFNRQGSAPHSMLIQPDGKIVLAGEGSLTGVAESLGEKAGPNAMTIIRYLPDGSPDESFGNGGTIHSLAGGPETLSRVMSIARQPDGDLVTAGYYFAGQTAGQPLGAWIVDRYKRDGSPDQDFGVDGRIMTVPDGVFPHANSVALQEDGHKILVAGDSFCGEWGRGTFVRYLADDGPPLPDRGPAMRSCDSTLMMETAGEIQLPVNCPMTESGCDGTVTLHLPAEVSSARRAKPRVGARIGRAGFKLKGGGTATLRVPANAAGRAAVKKTGRAKVVAVFVARDPKGHKRVTRRTLTVRTPRSR